MAIRLFWNTQNCFNKRCFTSFPPLKLKTPQLRCQQQVREFGNITKSKAESPHGSQNPQDLLVWSRLWRPVIFTVVFTGSTFSIAAIAEHERIKKRVQMFIQPRQQIIKAGQWRQQFNDFWSTLPDSKRMFIGISFTNCLVYAAWRIPRLQGFLKQYFTASPASKTLCLPMLLSTFSHVNLWHILLNMYVLDTFAAIAVPALGKEHFLAMYLSAGVFANLVSYASKIYRKTAIPSVGASGSIFGVFGFIAAQYPHLKFHIILLPMFTFTSSQTLYAISIMESIGLLSGSSFMDHGAHLGGLGFGMFWQQWGVPYLWPMRGHLLRLWEDFHENFRIK